MRNLEADNARLKRELYVGISPDERSELEHRCRDFPNAHLSVESRVILNWITDNARLAGELAEAQEAAKWLWKIEAYLHDESRLCVPEDVHNSVVETVSGYRVNNQSLRAQLAEKEKRDVRLDALEEWLRLKIPEARDMSNDTSLRDREGHRWDASYHVLLQVEKDHQRNHPRRGGGVTNGKGQRHTAYEIRL